MKKSTTKASSLHEAVTVYKYRESIPLFIDNGANVNAKDPDGNTPLHLACKVRCESQILEYLINAKALVDAKNNIGQTPIDIACARGYYELIPVLLRAGSEASNKVVGLTLAAPSSFIPGISNAISTLASLCEPPMPLELIRKQLHFLWGEGKQIDTVIDKSAKRLGLWVDVNNPPVGSSRKILSFRNSQ